VSTYEVTVTTTTPYSVTSDLSAEEIEQLIYQEVEGSGSEWADRYDPVKRAMYAQHPRKYAALLRNLPELVMDVDAYDAANIEIDVTEEEETPTPAGAYIDPEDTYAAPRHVIRRRKSVI
jgi:hypothetical protein